MNLRQILARRNYKLYLSVSKIWSLARLAALKLRLIGSRHIGSDGFGNGILKLNRTTDLGEKGELIVSPDDKTIFKFLVQHGEWEKKESHFLARQIVDSENMSRQNQRRVLLDIGANSGLISRQVFNISKSNCDFVLVEPIPQHVKAIEANFKGLVAADKIRIVESAIGESTGELEISIENSNRGNSSFLSSAMPPSGITKIKVKTMAVTEFYNSHLLGYDRYFVKSDTQGYDAKILSQLPKAFWDKCACAVIEIWALPEIEKVNVEGLLKMWHNIPFLNWAFDGSVPTSLEEIETFWLGKSGKSRNLFLARNKQTIK